MIYLVTRQYDCGLTIVECAATTEGRALLELSRCAAKFQARNPGIAVDIRRNVFYYDSAGVRFRIITTELHE